MGLRLVRNTTVPARVSRYLEPDERMSITVRRHPVSLSLTALPLAAVATLFCLHVTHVIHGTSRALAILGVLLALCCLLFSLHVIVWLRDYVVVTMQRLLIVRGWRRRYVTVIPIAEVGEMTFIRPVLGRLAGYGTFRLRRPGSRRRLRRVIKLSFLPYPEQLYLEAAGIVFRDPGQDAY